MHIGCQIYYQHNSVNPLRCLSIRDMKSNTTVISSLVRRRTYILIQSFRDYLVYVKASYTRNNKLYKKLYHLSWRCRKVDWALEKSDEFVDFKRGSDSVDNCCKFIETRT